MSQVHIENITEEDEAWDTYSVIDGMTPYRVEVVDGSEYGVYDTAGNSIKDDELAGTLIDQVINFRKGEK